MKKIGVCTSSRSERHLVQAIVNEANSWNYKLSADLIKLKEQSWCRRGVEYGRKESFWDYVNEYDFLIIPSDRSEMTKFALECFHNNIPFCHYLAGSQTHSFCHDDVNRWLISLMASFLFAESPEAAENLKRVGIPKDRILVTGTSHFDGITNYDIESNKPKDALEEPYDLELLNAETMSDKNWIATPMFDKPRIIIKPNEDAPNGSGKQYSHLEFLYLLKHCSNFISNSSAIIYEAPYLNRMGANIKVINPSKRNSIRTSISPEYCRGAANIISKWCETVDLNWLKTPKRLFDENMC